MARLSLGTAVVAVVACVALAATRVAGWPLRPAPVDVWLEGVRVVASGVELAVPNATMATALSARRTAVALAWSSSPGASPNATSYAASVWTAVAQALPSNLGGGGGASGGGATATLAGLPPEGRVPAERTAWNVTRTCWGRSVVRYLVELRTWDAATGELYAPIEWGSLNDMATNTRYWIYLATGSWAPPDVPTSSAYSLASTSFLAPPVPASYLFLVYRNDDPKSEMGRTALEVLPWERCGGHAAGSACVAGREGACSGHGTCVNGTCRCSGYFYWSDCSHGCDPEGVVLRGASGRLSSDAAALRGGAEGQMLYMAYTHCVWRIRPPGSYDRIALSFELLDLGLGDTLSVVIGDRADGLAAAVLVGSAAPPVREFSARSLTIVLGADYSNVGRGFVATYYTVTDPLSGGAVAGIAAAATVVGSVAVGALPVAALLLLRRRRAARERLLDTPAETWPPEDEAADGAEAGDVSTFEGTDVEIDKAALSFGVAAEGAAAVGTPLGDVLTVTNHTAGPVCVRTLVPDGAHVFALVAKPGAICISPGYGVELSFQFVLRYTTRVRRRVRVEVRAGSDIRDTSSRPLCVAHVRLALDGAISEWVDPDDLVVEPKPIGSGSSGAVYRAEYRRREVAVQILWSQDKMSAEQLAEFEAHVQLYKTLRSPYVVEFVGASRVPGKLCVCTELLPHRTLREAARRYVVPLALQLKMARDVCEAMALLHSLGVVHRDLKPSNVFVVSLRLREQVNCKVGDFSASRSVLDVRQALLQTCRGTPAFMAPELAARQRYSGKVDVYAFGLTLWSLLTRREPWEGENLWEVPDRVAAGDRPRFDGAESSAPAEYVRLIEACWAQDPEARPDWPAIQAALRALLDAQCAGADANKIKCARAPQAHEVRLSGLPPPGYVVEAAPEAPGAQKTPRHRHRKAGRSRSRSNSSDGRDGRDGRRKTARIADLAATDAAAEASGAEKLSPRKKKSSAGAILKATP
eukprot:m51a1_g7773 putative protein kinase domain containing protein (982) ;mRNA; r:156412-159658